MSRPRRIEEIKKSWATDERWKGIARPYTTEDIDQLRGTVRVEHTLARMGAETPLAFIAYG